MKFLAIMGRYKMKIIARPYTEADKSACLNVFKTNVGVYFSEEEVMDFNEFLIHQAEKCHYLVFCKGSEPEKLLACGGCGYIEDKVFLRWGMVKQSEHKTGVGTRLLLERLKLIKAQFGEVATYIETSQHVQGFYEKFGFVAISCVKDGFAPNIDKVKMVFNNWQGNIETV